MEDLKIMYMHQDEVVSNQNGLEEVGLYTNSCPALAGEDGPPPYCVVRQCKNPYEEERCPGMEDMGTHVGDGNKRLYVVCNWQEDQTYL